MSTDVAVIQEIWNPKTGELVPVTDTDGVAQAVQALREYNQRIRDAIADATTVLVEESRRQGKKTLHLMNTTVEIRGGAETVWDVEALRENLESAGCPPERIEEVIKTEVTYKVDARIAKQLAAANEDYAIAVELARSSAEKPFYVKVKEAEPF
jgi:hypothetical protein